MSQDVMLIAPNAPVIEAMHFAQARTLSISLVTFVDPPCLKVEDFKGPFSALTIGGAIASNEVCSARRQTSAPAVMSSLEPCITGPVWLQLAIMRARAAMRCLGLRGSIIPSSDEARNSKPRNRARGRRRTFESRRRAVERQNARFHAEITATKRGSGLV